MLVNPHISSNRSQIMYPAGIERGTTMSLLQLFERQNKTSAMFARERVQILVSHEQRNLESADFFPDWQRELLLVIKKYVPIDDAQVFVRVDEKSDALTFEITVILPEVKRAHSVV